MQYVDIPKKIGISDLLNNKASFSPHNYKKVTLGKGDYKFVRDFLSGDLVKGAEVGSDAYIFKSNKFFIRNKSLQPDSFLFSFTEDSVISILPDKFTNLHLKEGDIIISKDSNVGEVIILEKDYPNHMLSGGLYKMPVKENKHYLFAFLKHDFFKTQLNFLVSKGATIRHAKKLFLDCQIPFPPKSERESTVNFVETLVRAIIEKEKNVKTKEEKIFEMIDKELSGNQKAKRFSYHFPNFHELLATSRIDAGFYCENYIQKQFLIKNYAYDFGTIKDWGYDIGRGQNLQISAIGKSIYSDKKKEGFYVLVRPTNISDFGTVSKYEYLGNAHKLSTISEGDIIFSAEGSIGKCIMFANPKEKLITNIHGIVLRKKNHNQTESAFVSSFLRYLRKVGILDYISVGGQGGSLAMKYWSEVKIPFFPKDKQQEIANLYHNPTIYPVNKIDKDSFEKIDDETNKNLGILELDHQLRVMKEFLQTIIDKIVAGDNIEVYFSFVNDF